PSGTIASMDEQDPPGRMHRRHAVGPARRFSGVVIMAAGIGMLARACWLCLFRADRADLIIIALCFGLWLFGSGGMLAIDLQQEAPCGLRWACPRRTVPLMGILGATGLLTLLLYNDWQTRGPVLCLASVAVWILVAGGSYLGVAWLTRRR